jgi:hypothetical protein
MAFHDSHKALGVIAEALRVKLDLLERSGASADEDVEADRLNDLALVRSVLKDVERRMAELVAGLGRG